MVLFYHPGSADYAGEHWKRIFMSGEKDAGNGVTENSAAATTGAGEPSKSVKVAVLSLGNLLTAGITLLIFIIMSRLVSKDDYATYRQTFLAYQFAAPLLTLGLPSAIFYFLSVERERVRGRVVDILVISLSMGVFFFFFLLFGGERLLAWRFNNPRLLDTLMYLLPYGIFALPLGGVISSILVATGRIGALSAFNVASRMLIGLGAIIPVCVLGSMESSIIGQVAATGVALVAGLTLVICLSPSGSAAPDWSSIRSLALFAVPIGLADMLGRLSLQLDKVIVSSMCSLDDFAVYANGSIEIPAVGVITGSIASVIIVEMRKAAAEHKSDELIGLFRRAAGKSALFIMPVMAFLLINAELLITLCFSERYSQSASPFRIYLLLLPLRVVFFGSILTAIGKPKILVLGSAIALSSNLIFSILLVNMYGYIGAAWGTVLSTYANAVFYLIYLAGYFHIRAAGVLPAVRMFGYFAVSAAVAAISFLLSVIILKTDGALAFSINSAIFGAFVLIMWNGRIYSFKALSNRFSAIVPRR